MEKVTLSFKKNGKDKLLFDNHDLDRLIIENYGYEEYFYFNDLEDILKGIKMYIYFNDKVESIDLDFLMILSNDKFIFNKKEIDINNNKNKTSKLEDDILKFMIKNGSYKNDHYEYKIDNKFFKYYDELKQIFVERSSANNSELWIWFLDNFRLIYSDNSNYKINDKMVLCIDGECARDEKELYDRFYNYLNKYILSESN